MEDLIACLYPFDESRGAYEAIDDPQNRPRHVEQKRQAPEPQSRETTAPPDDDYEQVPPQDVYPGLELRFSHGFKGRLGIVFGTSRSSCDVVLPQIHHKNNGQPLISSQHFYIAFDEQHRLFVRDISTRGTIVTYDKEGGQKRSNFKWIIGGHKVPDETKTIVIEIQPQLQFQVVVSKHHLYPDLFFDNVDRFLREVGTNDELPFGSLGIESALSTAAPSGRDTPNQERILLKQERLGKGAFSVVSRVWDVSTGLEYASKKILDPEVSDWKKEVTVMRQISHEHILVFHFDIDGPPPRLVLEYLPLGNLEDQHRQRNISEEEVLTILQQAASALSYLHKQTPPVVHRDIKPENILVSSRSPLHIKLSDFGLAKAGAYLETACGTVIYVAPEIAQYYQRSSPGLRYTSAVDIWSLGVVAFRYGYGLPRVDTEWGLRWCQKIVDAVNDWDPDSLLDILSAMLVMDPKWRLSAEECLQGALELEAPSRVATPIPYGGQQHQIGESESRVLDPTDAVSPTFRQDDHHFRDSEILGYIRSQVPRHSSARAFEGDVRQEDSLRSIRDSEIQKYIRSKVPRHSRALAFEDSEDSLASTRDASGQVSIRSEARLRSAAPTIIDQRKRSTQRSATSSSSARRTKRSAAASSRSPLQYKEPSFAQVLQNDPNHAGYGEQNNSVGWDAFAPDANAQGSVNDRQGTDNTGYSRVAVPSISSGMGNFVEHDAQNSLERDASLPGTGQGMARYGENAENGWTESYLAARLLHEMRREGNYYPQ